MRTRVIFFVAGLLSFGAFARLCSSADVIHLKNGRTIWADHVRENGKHVEYDVGDDSYKISKSSVQSIEAGGLPPAYALSANGQGPAKDLPVFVPEDSLAGHNDLDTKVVHDGNVDVDALTSLEKEGKPELSATAYFLAGKHEFEHGNLPQAKRYFETALRFQPENSTILNYYAMALVAQHAHDAAGEAKLLASAQKLWSKADPELPELMVVKKKIQRQP